jgi:hypothetical protein
LPEFGVEALSYSSSQYDGHDGRQQDASPFEFERRFGRDMDEAWRASAGSEDGRRRDPGSFENSRDVVLLWFVAREVNSDENERRT